MLPHLHILTLTTAICSVAAAAPAPPSDVTAQDIPLDDGGSGTIEWSLSPDDHAVSEYSIEVPGEDDSWQEVGRVPGGIGHFNAAGLSAEEPLQFGIRAIHSDGSMSERAISDEVTLHKGWFNLAKLPLFIITVLVCGAVIYFIRVAKSGREIKVRPIAGLEAIEEAVGRATEMGRNCLFIPGILDMNDVQTIAGLNILSRVAETAAEYGARVEVPTSRALVMTTARETVQAAYLTAGRPDAYNEDEIYYVTDEQFGYVAYLSGIMVREKPAACFYLGAFYAESLILAETGNAIGAIQVAGTAMPAQLPFFVAACDYTLIGEEFFAASAYLTGSPEELGSLKGQDMGKVLAGILMVIGIAAATLASVTDWGWVEDFTFFIKETVL